MNASGSARNPEFAKKVWAFSTMGMFVTILLLIDQLIRFSQSGQRPATEMYCLLIASAILSFILFLTSHRRLSGFVEELRRWRKKVLYVAAFFGGCLYFLRDDWRNLDHLLLSYYVMSATIAMAFLLIVCTFVSKTLDLLEGRYIRKKLRLSK